jgi:Xaa-Pro aminopeptidase
MLDQKLSLRLTALRAAMTKAGYDGFLIPMADEYQSEYVPPSAKRLEFMTGFSGSAGFAIVMRDKAAFFTDGRYVLQAHQQVPADLFSLHDSTAITPATWLAEQVVNSKVRIAYDPWLHTDSGITHLKTALKKTGAELVPARNNLVDTIWTDRPAPPAAPIEGYDIAFAGERSADKRKKLADELKKNGCSAAIITDPASVAWLLNIRGNDVPNTPLPLSFAILYDTAKVAWFVDPRKITKGLTEHLGSDIIPHTPEDFAKTLDALGKSEKAIRIDPAESASWIVERLRATKVMLDLGDDPCVLPKACKNPVELQGMRNCHTRDGAAIATFLAWLDANVTSGKVTELDVEQKLAACRTAGEHYRGPSFDTIAGAGEHGAIVHYRATTESNRTLKSGELFLLDSGGQYLDGTTDVTRTLVIGTATDEMRDRFTRVLRGHIALARIRFPSGITGAELDVLARQYLWSIGLDYNHGTGHGVGSFLGVHEGPQSISRRSTVPLKPGMVVSNEPGFYKAGHFGIRIENLQAVVSVTNTMSEKPILGFETLTLVPIDTRVIEMNLMTADDIAWLNTYHTKTRETLLPMVDTTTAKWLLAATKAI